MPTLLISLEPGTLSDEQIAQVKQAAPGMDLLLTRDKEKIEAALDDIVIATGWISRELIPRAPKLRWFQQWSAGTEWLLDMPPVREHPFKLTNASGVHAINIGEHIFAFLLAFARGFPAAARIQQSGTWKKVEQAQLFELEGKTMLLVGVGAIGLRTAQLAQAFGMRVIGVRRNPEKKAAAIDRMVGPDDLPAVLPEADFVVITVPLTEETRQMIAEAELKAMKPSAYLVNIGRGKTVDEAALVEALEAGRLAGAGLDVFAEEPLPEDSPLWKMQNVIITCHYSGVTPMYNRRAFGIFLDNLKRFQAGEPLRNLVNKELGY
jgi:phosphoglycerate dehydrogenase-like enzyme